MQWLPVFALLFVNIDSRYIIPTPEDIHKQFLLKFIKDFDRKSLYQDRPYFEEKDFEDFPIVETTIGEDQHFKKCTKNHGGSPEIGPWPEWKVHCEHCLDMMRSYRKTFRQKGPFLFYYNLVKMVKISEDTRCSFKY